MKPTNYKAPSRASLMQHLNCTREQADLARALIRGEEPTLDNPRFPRSNVYFSSCYSRPRRTARILACLDELLETHGVEPIWGSDPFHPVAEYLNTGETYAQTLLFTGRSFLLTSWGEWIERNQARYAIR